MTSGNAFRDGAAHALVATTDNTSNGDTGHARKRCKLSPPPQANIFTKTGDASASLEVDHMILDYLSYEATKAVLVSRRSRDLKCPSLERKLALVDAFMEMFKAKHPNFEPDPELRFRLLLLKFTTLYCRRLVRCTVVPPENALHRLREVNKSRAMNWIQSADRMPSSKYEVTAFEEGEMHDRVTKTQHQQSYVESRRANTLRLLGFPVEDEAYEDSFYGTPQCLVLLDLLPLFMSVIAARNELNNSNLSKGLMDLAGQFMLQAGLEQYLVCGATGCDAIDEAFAWGYKPGHLANGHDESDPVTLSGDVPVDSPNETDRMFQDEDDNSQEVPDWRDVKSGFIAQLAHIDGESLMHHLESVADRHPIDAFEDTVLQLLAGLAASLPTPVLTQLEEGNLDDMSSAETKAFLRDCGLDGHWLVLLE